MGKDVTCEGVSGSRRGAVRVQLDAERLRVSGAFRANVHLDDLRGLTVRKGTLCFEAAGETVWLELGEKAAAVWAKEIANPKSLIEKLGVKAGQRVCILGLDTAFTRDVARAVEGKPFTALRGSFDAIFLAIESETKLDRIARCKAYLVPNGALWIVSPKGKGSPVRESAVRAAILAAELVDTKVVSFSATHTAAKAVIPLAARR